MALTNVSALPNSKPRAAEFFAGIGLARLGLEASGIDVSWSNDIEPAKRDMYEGHFLSSEDHEFRLGDIAAVTGDDIPDVQVAWSSFPCTDLSLAGGRAGLAGASSSTFFHFIRILEEMGARAPEVVAVENVHGLATSHGGDDLSAAIRALNELGYSVDVLSIDARRFVPQSRPRLFIVGAKNPPEFALDETPDLRPDFLQVFFGDPSLRMHRAPLPPLPAPLTSGLGSYVETMGDDDARWWDADRTARFIDSLSSLQLQRFERFRQGADTVYRTAYRRTRRGVAVWEVRPDDISGCLRTARGGSSKQAIVQLGRGGARIRWMTPLEYARLMGAGDYQLDGLRTNQVLFGFGDAVCAPAVAWVGEHYLLPLIEGRFEAAAMPALRVVNG